jgi:hypothetical protein
MLGAAERHIRDACVWAGEVKKSFIDFMRAHGWQIVVSETEADVQVARDCKPKDIVVTRDSDLIAYHTVHTVWRLIGKGRVLEYDLTSVMQATKLSREQLTTLCIVSTNDYSQNLPQLGVISNYQIVKRLKAKGIDLSPGFDAAELISRLSAQLLI